MRQDDMIKLQEFVDTSKSKGATDEFLAALLTRRGWPAGDVYSALGQFWERATGLAIPARAGAGESARDAFLYLLSFATLATWTTAVGSMLFDFINYWFPDSVSRSYVYDLRTAVTWQMAAVVVAFPIYLLVMRVILREATERPEQLESGVRKWLTYLSLLGTAGAMICDLITFLDYFLTGELTTRFVLKAVTVMLIAGGVFAYYLGSLRGRRSSRAFGIAAAVAVVGTFCIGLAVAGTPAKQRQMEADRKRVEDLRNIAAAIKVWHDADSTIPPTLAELMNKHRSVPRMTDLETNMAYEYHLTQGSAYELCANFLWEERPDAGRRAYSPNSWEHAKGRSCFALDASKAVPY